MSCSLGIEEYGLKNYTDSIPEKINAIGFGAADVSLKYGLQTYIREIGARWLAMYDTIRGTQATVLGDKVEISENAEKNISE